jgi:DNA topoisomerase VI subunit B
MSIDRRFHRDTRVSENFSKDRLETLTGQPSGDWGRYVVKELVDNALEAAEQADHDEPAVSLSLNVEAQGRRAYARRVTVANNGPDFDRETLKQITDVTEFGGTKRHYALPTRGAQDNALMTILGIQYLADGGPLTITSGGRTYKPRSTLIQSTAFRTSWSGNRPVTTTVRSPMVARSGPRLASSSVTPGRGARKPSQL